MLYGILTAACLVVSGVQTQAGTATFDFTADPATLGVEVKGNNPQPWNAAGGNPGGFLALTYPEGSQYAAYEFPDIDAGKIVTSFRFEADLRVGNSSGDRAADGFSVNFARATDDLVVGDLSGQGGFASGCAECGAKSGIAVSFDTWSGNALPDGPDLEGIIVRVDNVTVSKTALPTRHGACDDNTSMQTGPRDPDYWANGGDPHDAASWAGLCWKKIVINLAPDGKLTVEWKGRKVLDAFQTSYFPSAGKLILAGRTGGANEHTHFDNIKLTTTAITDNTPPSVASGLKGTAVHARRIKLDWTAATDDSGKVAYEVERDGVVLPGLINALSYSENVKPETSYVYKVRAVDPALNRSAFTAAVTVKTPVEPAVFSVGLLKWEAYAGIGGVAIDAMTSDAKYPNSPDDIKVLSKYEGPTGYGDNYGARITGFITPTETGNYIFFISADDNAQFFLSTDDKPANKKLIASEPQWNGERDWVGLDRRDADLPENRSDKFAGTEWPTGSKVTLTGGKRYFTEFLYKEGGGGDNGAVAMIKEGAALPANGSPALSGSQIGAVLDPNQGKPSIVETPKGATLAVGAAATMSTKAVGSPPLIYQWTFAPFGTATGKDIAGATSATYSIPSASGADAGFYGVTVKNDEGSASSAAAMVTLEGTLFIETEDFNFGGGKTITDKPIGMTGPYPGGDFAGLGTDADVDIDYNNAGGNAGQPYRPGTGVAAGKPNAHADGIPRGGFNVTLNHVVGWNDPGDWQNYTRTFPTPAKDYAVYGRLSSGGSAINQQLDEVTAGAKTTAQTLKKIGVWAPGRATAGWDIMEWFPLTDDAQKPITLNLGGEKTFRVTAQPSSNLDMDYMMFVPAGAAPIAMEDVILPGDSIVSSHLNSDSPGGEQVGLAIDNKTTTKYLNFKKLNTGFTVTSSAGGSVVTGISLTSANDSPNRDPASYKLEGSNDGAAFTLIAEGAVKAFTARFQRQEILFANTAQYSIYRITFPTVSDAATANSMQIAEVEFLGKVTAARAKLGISTAAGKITITYTGTLQGADAVTGPYTDVAGATSPRDVAPTAAMKFYRAK